MTEERRQRIDKIKALAKRLRREYRDDPNIVSVSWGMARQGGKAVPRLALIFFVKEKLDSEKKIRKAGSRPAPREVDGIPTDVKTHAPMQPLWAGSRADKIADPLAGGVATTNLEKVNRTFFWSSGGPGTLGILCRDSNGDAMALSNWHVWADQGAEVGDKIIQPQTPDGATYAESITKVGACGPFLSTVIEGRTPSPLAAGLYAGAAAAGILAAATDHKDPIRRGQEATHVDPATSTHSELLQMELGFPEMIPWVGQPFPIDVEWTYTRQTNVGDQTVEVNERRVNPQILLGQAVAPDRAGYRPGDFVTMRAAIWDYQDRPEDAYHVTAHLIPEAKPDIAYRAILHPSICRPMNFGPRYGSSRFDSVNPVTHDDNLVCIDFGRYSPSTAYREAESFGPLGVVQRGDEPLRIVHFTDALGSGLYLPGEGLTAQHPPASGVRLRVAQLTSRPVVVRAFNRFGALLGEAEAPNVQGQAHELTIASHLIARVEIRGGGGEGVLLSYCFTPEVEEIVSTIIPDQLLEAYREIDVPFISGPDGNIVNVRRRCFQGRKRLPQDAPSGRYRIYLTVSNVNHAPPGRDPVDAARIIGGQELGTHSQALLCTFMLLGDHTFDIF